MKWIKIVADFCDDEKIKIIRHCEGGDTFIWIWIWLLTTAMKKETDTLYLVGATPYDPGMIAMQAGVKEDAAHKAIDIFCKLGMIDITENGGIFIINWAKHQSMTAMIEKRESARIRKERERSRKQELIPLNTSNVTRDTCDSHATEENRIEESRVEKEVNTLPSIDGDDFKRIESSFCECYIAEIGKPCHINYAAFRRNIKDYIKQYGVDEIISRIKQYFTLDAKYYGRDILTFLKHWNKIPSLAQHTSGASITFEQYKADFDRQFPNYRWSDDAIKSLYKEYETKYGAKKC